ncbi:formate/nitrite transporter family protein [Clostridium sp. D53t1_180928_C8]|uniref:formate/nitrite transporter family protein n=1 Tax=Clostridium sp. D53t1_180928_C8 TaxID=2787101 RepID=UPI0018AB2862|nr:formate/nitrite transporter family protein [Clostridium sp. D53t1_180928_C8]
MFNEEFNKVAGAAKAKSDLLKNNKVGYFASSMLAGLFVGMAIMLIFTIGGLLIASASPATKIVMGIAFGGALSLVVFAGSELFTGNNFIMAVGSLNKNLSWLETIKVWIVSFIGNLVGSILSGYMFYLTGLAKGPVGEFIANTAATKMSLPAQELFFRGLFCNILVCLAVWCTFRCKDDVSKLIMIFWCLFIFITAGFEHSVANMTLLTIALLSPGTAAVSIVGYIYNIVVVTLGNMVGGILFVAIPYYLISRKGKAVK